MVSQEQEGRWGVASSVALALKGSRVLAHNTQRWPCGGEGQSLSH